MAILKRLSVLLIKLALETAASLTLIRNVPQLGGIFHFYSYFLKKLLCANSGEPGQTPRFAASDLVLHCLPMSNKKDVRLILVKRSC